MATHPSAAPPAHPGRRRRLAVAAALVTPLLAACGTGFQAETNQIYQPGPGITVRESGVFALNTLIVTDGDGNGTLVSALVNQRLRPDSLRSVDVKTRTGKELKTRILSGIVTLPSHVAVQLAHTGVVRVTGTLEAGSFCFLTLTFRNAAPIEVQIPIVADSDVYDRVPLGPVPPPTTPSHSNPS